MDCPLTLVSHVNMLINQYIIPKPTTGNQPAHLVMPNSTVNHSPDDGIYQALSAGTERQGSPAVATLPTKDACRC